MSDEFYDGWRERIGRLRKLSDMQPPWHLEADIEKWKRGLGVGPNSDDALNLHMLEWQVWLRSLSPEDRRSYQLRYPEPPGWSLYRLTFSQQGHPVPENQGAVVYWDSLLEYYETCAKKIP